MFDVDFNVQLGVELLKIHNPKLTLIFGVEHTFYLFSMLFLNNNCKLYGYISQVKIKLILSRNK